MIPSRTARTQSGGPNSPSSLSFVRRLGSRIDRLQLIGVSILVFFWICWNYTINNTATANVLLSPTIEQNVSDRSLSKGVSIRIVTTKASEKESIAAVGSGHWAEVKIAHGASSCGDVAPFSMRLVGDVLVPIVLQLQNTDSNKKRAERVWLGQFEVPLPGRYTLDFEWFGCLDNGAVTTGSSQMPSLKEPIELEAAHPEKASSQKTLKGPKDSYLFSKSFWLAKALAGLGNVSSTAIVDDYIFADPSFSNRSDDDVIILPSGDDSYKIPVSKSGTFTADHGMYRFGETGNYELVCFWGGATMYTIRSLFLAERKFLAPGQRPFKFHYYNITDMVRPDTNWALSDKERCRKCKHIFLSLDDVNLQLSQIDFEWQFVTFVDHLQKLMNDTTFPIWVLTLSSPPTISTSGHCHEPYQFTRTTDHPCNDVIRNVISANSFQPRVHLMDNADIVLPSRGSGLAERSLLANIAMRVFVAVGKGVAEWRAHGQHGLVDGLHRNDTIEPNFKLVPYTGWSVNETHLP